MAIWRDNLLFNLIIGNFRVIIFTISAWDSKFCFFVIYQFCKINLVRFHARIWLILWRNRSATRWVGSHQFAKQWLNLVKGLFSCRGFLGPLWSDIWNVCSNVILMSHSLVIFLYLIWENNTLLCKLCTRHLVWIIHKVYYVVLWEALVGLQRFCRTKNLFLLFNVKIGIAIFISPFFN